MSKRTLQIQQLNNKMLSLLSVKQVLMPSVGWVKAIRTAVGMSMQQLGNKLSITKQAVMDIEKREQEGSITIKSLKEIGKVLDMQLVYGFVPNDGSLDSLIEKKARELAMKIVMRTSNSMKLEGQEISQDRMEKAIQEKMEELKKEMPKNLWD